MTQGKSGVVEWNDAELKALIADEVEDRLREAGELVEGKARTNLDRVLDPKWGRKYRRKLAFEGLTTHMRVEYNFIAAIVGMKLNVEGFGYSKHFGFYIETGSSRYAAQPWLRPALLMNLNNIKKLFDS